MPNWCNNRLVITGDRSIVSSLPWIDNEEKYLFERYFEKPEDAIATWGCKWDCSVEFIDLLDLANDRSELQLQFDSPWTPPINGIVNLSKILLNVLFAMEYYIAGDYQGQIEAENGKLLSHQVKSVFGADKTCPCCGATYQPECDWYGEIIHEYCDTCGTSF